MVPSNPNPPTSSTTSKLLQSLCTHPINSLHPSITISYYNYCTTCGILFPSQVPYSNNLREFSKPSNYQRPISIDPLEHINRVRTSYNNSFIYRPSLNEISQEYLKERTHSVFLLKELCLTSHLSDKSFFTSLMYLDKIMLHRINFTKSELYLITISCLLLAGKFVENNTNLYKIITLLSHDEKYQYRFSIDEIKKKEIETVKMLDYNLNDSTPYSVLLTMMFSGIIFKEEVKDDDTLNQIYLLCFRILTKIIHSEAFILFSEYSIAFSIVYLVRRKYNLSKSNLKLLKKIYNIHFLEFRDCAMFIKE